MMIIGFVLTITAYPLIRRGRRHLARIYVDVLRSDALTKDGRAPILYLRSFSEDGNAASLAVAGPGMGRMFSKTQRRILWLFLTLRLSYEQVLTHAFRRLGPVVAIGKPEEGLPTLGALREYVEDSRWRKRVMKIAAASQLVIMQIATSDGLIWELRRMIQALAPEKIVLAVPQRQRSWLFRWRQEKKRQRAYQEFREKSLPIFVQHPLPEAIGRSQFVYFDEDWKPRLSVPPGIRLFPRLGRGPRSGTVAAALGWLDSVLDNHKPLRDFFLYYLYFWIWVGFIGLAYLIFKVFN